MQLTTTHYTVAKLMRRGLMQLTTTHYTVAKLMRRGLMQLTITHYTVANEARANSLYCTRGKAKATVYHTLVFSEARYR
jgi:hypothetical protein